MTGKRDTAGKVPGALPLGAVLKGRYKVEKVLGAGGFGITYLVLEIDSGTKRVIKELFPQNAVSRRPGAYRVELKVGGENYYYHAYRNFVNEADILAGLRGCRGVVPVYERFDQNQTAYYVMKYLPGKDLKSIITAQGKMQWRSVRPIFSDIFAALDVIHQKNLMHRDVSPDNIVTDSQGRGWLIDFGSARYFGGQQNFTAFLKESFAPVEQYLTSGQQGPWTDIYSVSVSLYYALSGKLPPKAPERIIQDQAVPIGRLCPELPTPVAAAIQKGMEPEISHRYQSIREYSQGLFGEKKKNSAILLRCEQGCYLGRTWSIKEEMRLTVGRTPGCTILYPGNYQGVSRLQLTVMRRENGLLIRDEHSSFGTYLNRKRLAPGQWYQAGSGSVVGFGKEVYKILYRD